MGYLGPGFVLLAVLGGAGGGSGSCQPAPSVKTVAPTASAAVSPSASSNPTAAPSPSPLESGPHPGHPVGCGDDDPFHRDRCPVPCQSLPFRACPPTSPRARCLSGAPPTFNPALKCGASAPGRHAGKPTSGPCDGPAMPPAMAAIEFLGSFRQRPEAAPAQFTLARLLPGELW